MKPGARSQESGARSSKKPSSGGGLVFIALGSNLGEADKNVLKAMEELQKLSDVPLQKSSLWKTAPVDCPSGSPSFINAVIGMVPRAGETPESLLAKLQALEKQLGRKPKKVLNEPRILDLDIVAFGNEARATPELTLPHPRAHQ